MTVPGFAELDAIAHRIAAYVGRQNKHMDHDDLAQVAWVSFLEWAIPTHDPAKGPFRAWAWMGARRPATWASCAAKRDATHAEALAARVALDPPEEVEDPETITGRARWRRDVTAEVRRLLRDTDADPIGMRVVFGEAAADIADEVGLSKREVLARGKRVREVFARSRVLRGLWKERP